jgi:hypothetical protein
LKLASLLLAAGCLLSTAVAVQPGFDPEDVVRRVRSSPLGPSAVSREPSVLDGAFLIDTSITRVPAQFGQRLPAVACDGANFLVVWQDDRYGVISGARVTPQGKVLEPAGIVITPVPGDRGAPDVGFDGENFLVAWEENRVGTDWDIIGTRVSPQGKVLDPLGITISAAAEDQFEAALAFDGTNYCVVWEDGRDDTLFDIYGARVTSEGLVLDPAGIPISTDTNAQLTPAVAFDGAGFFVAWEDYRPGVDTFVSDIYGARVTQQGTVLDAAGIPVSAAKNAQLLPALVYDGVNLLATWADNRNVSDFAIYGARVTPQGTVLDPDGFIIAQAASDQYFPAAGFDGSNFFVAWADLRGGTGYDIYGARVTPQGAVLDTAGFLLFQAVANQYDPAIGFDGANFLLAWEDDRGGTYDIYAGRATPEGGALDPAGFLVSQSANDQNSPVAGFDGENFLVAWADDRKGSGWDIFGARVTPDGAVLDPAGFVISEAAKDQRLPAVSFDGTNFLLVWGDYRSDPAGDIYGARVTSQGEVLDLDGLVISQAVNAESLPAVAFDGTNSLVVWADLRDSTRFHIFGARVTPGGSVLDPSGITITTAPGFQYAPAVASDGANTLVVWQDTRSGSDWDIIGTRVSPQGEVLDPAGVALSQEVNNQRFPATVFDGTNFLVVWEDNRYGSDYDIFGARATREAVVLDTTNISISAASENQRLPAVGLDSAGFLVVWQDYRNGIDYDIFGARLSSEGTVSDSGAFVSEPQDQTLARLGAGSGGRRLLVYQGWAANVGGKEYNANRVWGKANPRPSNRVAVLAQEFTTGKATIVRGLLHMPVRPGPSRLLDATGRKVLDLLPGANDVRALAPGVYFMRAAQAQAQAQAVRKVVITR